VISEEAGVHKPDPRVFQRALDELACAGAEAWFVGDHPHNDVLGSAAVGMQPIWLAGVHPWPEGVARPGHRIDRIEDVIRAVLDERD
jgi:putative hydrolase of the HAD superfamily